MSHLYIPPNEPPPPWRHSPAKALLRKGIIDGTYPDTMSAEQIYGSRLEFRQYHWGNFNTNLRNLRAALKRDIGRANTDAANFAADRLLHPGGEGQLWVGSAAERFMKEDVDAERHLEDGMTPEKLRGTRDAYQEWSLKKFRDHLTQEIRSRKTQAYWLHRSPETAANEEWPTINSL